MNKILIVHTSWYKDYIKTMIESASNKLTPEYQINLACAPGAIELAALAKHKILKEENIYAGILFLGIVVRGETTHYELVTNETFRSIGDLALDFSNISVINNVICVENKDQLLKRLTINTENNAKALISLINEKSI
ncbi:MAG: 6,7-dimethyl-8-ribityllumazine synthase [Gammaproteobacteria bacterium]|jgi:6,7-dimethyl-8-ribityllumazine synthase|tara:strand:- start:1491 stop:1901 length:411 start_codon:yes stop_codon:yes gene_type:complete